MTGVYSLLSSVLVGQDRCAEAIVAANLVIARDARDGNACATFSPHKPVLGSPID